MASMNFYALQLAFHKLEYNNQPSGYDHRYIKRTKQAINEASKVTNGS